MSALSTVLAVTAMCCGPTTFSGSYVTVSDSYAREPRRHQPPGLHPTYSAKAKAHAANRRLAKAINDKLPKRYQLKKKRARR